MVEQLEKHPFSGAHTSEGPAYGAALTLGHLMSSLLRTSLSQDMPSVHIRLKEVRERLEQLQQPRLLAEAACLALKAIGEFSTL